MAQASGAAMYYLLCAQRSYLELSGKQHVQLNDVDSIIGAPGVNVALVSKLSAAASDGITQVHRAINGQAVWLAGGHALQEPTRSGDVENSGDIGVRFSEVSKNTRGVGSRECVEVTG